MLKGRKQTRKCRLFNVPSEAWNFADGSNQKNVQLIVSICSFLKRAESFRTLHLLYVDVKVFLFFMPSNAIQHQELQVCSFFWRAVMWKIKVKNKDKPENLLIFENWCADIRPSDAFSVFCYNTSAASGFELLFLEPFFNLNEGMLWYETWNSLGELLKVQTALFLVYTQIKWKFLVSIIYFSFTTWSTDQNKTAAPTLFMHLLLTVEESWECVS